MTGQCGCGCGGTDALKHEEVFNPPGRKALDYRVAVTTSGRDVQYEIDPPPPLPGFPIDPPAIPVDEEGDDGAFRQACGMQRRWVERTDPDVSGTFSCAAEVGTGGPALEMPLYSMELAFTERVDDGTNGGFLRDVERDLVEAGGVPDVGGVFCHAHGWAAVGDVGDDGDGFGWGHVPMAFCWVASAVWARAMARSRMDSFRLPLGRGRALRCSWTAPARLERRMQRGAHDFTSSARGAWRRCGSFCHGSDVSVDARREAARFAGRAATAPLDASAARIAAE